MVLLHQYTQVLKLQFFRMSGLIVVMAFVQIILALGIAIGFTFLYSDIDPQSLLYLATGAPTVIILITGLSLMPMQIANAKIDGHAEFLRTLPVNRIAIMMADATIWILETVPGIVIATLVTHLIYQPGFDVSLWSIPAYLLCVITSIGVGYGFSYALPPMLAISISQILVFITLTFSPITFPASRFPMWLQTVHTILPIDSMAQIMRASFATGTFDLNPYDIIKVTIWCALGFVLAIRVLNKK